MKKTYLALIPLLTLVLSGCGTTEVDDEYVHSVEEIRALDYAPEAKINGRVVAVGYRSYILYDGTGCILHYVGNAITQVKVGDKITVTGPTSLRGGLTQFDTEAEIAVYKGDLPEFDLEPTHLNNLDEYYLDDVVYASFDRVPSYNAKKETDTYDDFVSFNAIEGQTSYLDFNESKSSYCEAIKETSADFPVPVNITGFIISFTGASSYSSTGCKYGMILSKELEETDLALLDLEITDDMPYYNLTTSFDEYNWVQVHGTYERDMNRIIPLDLCDVSLIDSENNPVDTSVPFASAGTYKLTITHDGVTSNTISFEVHNDSYAVTYKDPHGLAKLNGWSDGKSYHKDTKDMGDVTYYDLDEYIGVQVGGKSCGAYSDKNNSWSVKQGSNSTYPDGGYFKFYSRRGFEIKKVLVTYYPNGGTTDTGAKEGYLEGLQTGEVVDINSTEATFYAKAKMGGDIEDSYVRIHSILAVYEQPVFESAVANDSHGVYYTKSTYDLHNNLGVTATYSNQTQDATVKSRYFSYVVKNSEGEVIDSSKNFPEAGTYSVHVTYHGTALDPIDVTVSGDTLITVSKTANELGALNGWKTGSSTNKTGKMDDNVSLTVVGSSSGKWNNSGNGVWKLTQAKTSSQTEDSNLEIVVPTMFKINSVAVTYDSASTAHLEFRKVEIVDGVETTVAYPLEDATAMAFENTNSVKLFVAPNVEDATGTVAHISSITVVYEVI